MHRAARFSLNLRLSFRAIHDVKSFSSSSSFYGLKRDITLKESYLHGSTSIPLVGKTIGVALQDSVEKFPDRDAFVYGTEGSRQTYRQLLDEVDRFAAGLMAAGIKKGDRVGIWGPNIKEWILTQFACARIGAILVNVNPAYRVEETVYALKMVGMKAIVAPPSFKTQDYYGILKEICPELETGKAGNLRSERLPDLKTVVITGTENLKGTYNFDDVMEMGQDKRHDIEKLCQDLQFDEGINIQFTSGTTGRPKGTLLSHHGILNNSYFCGLHFGLDEEGVVLSCPLPLYHVGGMVCGSLAAIVHGVTCTLPSPTFEPEALLKSVQDEKCTSFLGVPTVYFDSLNHPDFEKYDTSTVRHCGIGGAPCPEELLKLLQNKLNVTPMVVFGMTEAGPITNATRPEDRKEIILTTSGKPFDHVEVKVIDPQTKKILPVGERGEVCMRSYGVMKGYWNDPEKTKEVLRDGWMHSGDLGMMDAEGNLSIVGRIKELIIRGAVNIFPAEIEEFIYKHPKVENVQIVGVPDERMGEELCACIKLKQGETSNAEEIKEFCKGQIAHFKIPRYVEFVESFPLTVSLKVQKFALQEMMANKLDLSKREEQAT
ncbi:Acyl-CoA synthetase family member 2, mitochondrial [Holothuria leucospilota]|uniref:Medium-chain acyl-CoA ligase ACSF2, mitochondrial n=1 Tax=Holothuria leucospilota TaxID=206669 RepID=A0A9Q1BGQ2_HOLLE|nr:Acyl-CoA synthetase family member 2, mitochondrial [Holothuria leucospilota]